MRFIHANRDTVALIEDGARFSDFLVDWTATPIRFWWNSIFAIYGNYWQGVGCYRKA
jgi:hypothetical protein